MREAVVVSTARTPVGRAHRGAFNDTEAPVLAGHVMKAAVERAGIDPARIGDVFLRAEYLRRRTKMSLGEDPQMRFKYGAGPDGTFDPFFVKDGGHVDLVRWRQLGARVTQPVQFGYLVNAGRSGEAPPTLQLTKNPVIGTPTEPWYVIQARADYDDDEKYCNVVAASWTPEVFMENEGE